MYNKIIEIKKEQSKQDGYGSRGCRSKHRQRKI